MRLLGLIPARAGSRGVPGKNVALVAGRPLVDYTILAAKKARSLDEVCVSTDDPRVAARARRHGVRVIERPRKLAGHKTPMLPAVLHALEALAPRTFDAVMLLQPTSPLRSHRHIDAAAALYRRKRARSLVSVCPVSQHPCECLRIDGGRLKPAVARPNGASGRQDFPEYWYLNGAIYITDVRMLREQHRFWDAEAALYRMGARESLDIDEPWHLAQAQALVGGR